MGGGGDRFPQKKHVNDEDAVCHYVFHPTCSRDLPFPFTYKKTSFPPRRPLSRLSRATTVTTSTLSGAIKACEGTHHITQFTADILAGLEVEREEAFALIILHRRQVSPSTS